MLTLEPFTGQLGEKHAAHLLRRATFGPTKQDILNFASKTPDEALTILLADVPVPDPPVDPKTGTTWLNPKAGTTNSAPEDLVDYFMAWHLEQMRDSGNSLRERMTYFYHTHIPTRRTLVKNSESLYYQNTLFRYYAFGNFKDLFRRICVDNAMLVFLDGATNQADSPNENFAREMLELYSIGRGPQSEEGDYTNYTETDVRQATRVLTGFTNDDTYTNLDDVTKIPTGKLITEDSSGPDIKKLAVQHDKGQKTFSDRFQNTIIEPSEIVDGYATDTATNAELDAMMDMIFNQDATAQFICRKLYRFFVYHEIPDEVETQIIEPLATTFKSNNYEIKPVLERLLKSKHFYDSDNTDVTDDNQGALIKSPLELILGTLRFFNVALPDANSDLSGLYQQTYQKGILQMIYDQGLNFYEPFEVAGYPAYQKFPAYNRNWITPYYLAYRYKFAQWIITGVNPDGGDLGCKMDILEWVKNSGNVADPSDPSQIVNGLIDYLIPFDMQDNRRNYFLNDVFLDGLYPAAWTAEWNAYIANPSQNEASVRSNLELFISALIQSPEYQLF